MRTNEEDTEKRFDSGYLDAACHIRYREMKVRGKRVDSISVDNTYYTDEGYLVDHPIVTTCGVFEYKNEDGSTRRELRLPEDVFAEKSLKSYKGKALDSYVY